MINHHLAYDTKPLSRTMSTKSMTPYGVTRPQNVNSLRPSDAYVCVSNLTIIGSDNGLSPGRRQAIIWTNAGILFTGPLGSNFSEFLIEILTFSFKKMHLKVSSGKWRPFCLGLNVLTEWTVDTGTNMEDVFSNYFYTCRRIGDKPLPEPILTKIHDAI